MAPGKLAGLVLWVWVCVFATKMQNAAESVEGRNPQTGKEISTAKKKKERTGRNPQTGKEIQISKKNGSE